MKTGNEERITFPSGPLVLEALLARGAVDKGVVISHPHPLYGGEMRNPVLDAIQEVFAEKGWATLRFNFRGVGRSQGKYDQGMGEQDDVRAAVRFLKDLGIREIVLAGYSFGAWINAQAALDLPEVAQSILVAPPQAMLDFSFLKEDTKTRLVIAGEWDSFGPLEELRQIFGGLKHPPTFKIIAEADHFFGGATSALKKALEDFFA